MRRMFERGGADAIGANRLGRRARSIRRKPTKRLCLATVGRQVHLPLPGGAAVSREAFDTALVAEAVAAGVRFVSGVAGRIGSCDVGARRVELIDSTSRISVRSKVVVAATGLSGVRIDGRADLAPTAAPNGRIGVGAVLTTPPPAFQPETIYMAVGAGGLRRLRDVGRWLSGCRSRARSTGGTNRW